MESLREVAEALHRVSTIKFSVGTLFIIYVANRVRESYGQAIVQFVLGGIGGILKWVF